jgi:hypothetical protein
MVEQAEHSTLEFHDSSVIGVEELNTDILVFLRAYVQHWVKADGEWNGRGVAQKVKIAILDGKLDPGKQAKMGKIYRGSLQSNSIILSSTVPIPCRISENVTLTLKFRDDSLLRVSGNGAIVELAGEATYVEELPAEWAPDKE